jgi:RNA polymerase sigma factor (sigma-70 family)
VSLEREFLDHLPVIDQVVQFIGRRHRLEPDAIEELQSAIHLKIIDNDYEVLRKFEGRSSIRTYLTAVVQRHFLDSRTAMWGRWRPCACARRAGPPGVMLDQLLTRDAVSLDEAVARVRQRHDVSEPALRSLAARIPVRTPRRFLGEEALEDVPSDAALPPADATLRRDEAQRAESALETALRGLGPEDQVILKYRFVYGLQVSQISRMTGLEQKPLYRRLEGILKVMRREMEAQGLTREHVMAVVGSPGVDIGGTMAWPEREKRPERPSL